MKKLLTMVSIVCLFVCIFALSINAEAVISESNKDANGDIVADIVQKLTGTNDETHIASVDFTYTTTEGNEKSGKIYYEISLWTQQNKRQLDIIYLPADFDMSQIVYFLDKADINGDGSYSSNEYIYAVYNAQKVRCAQLFRRRHRYHERRKIS